MDVDLRTVFPEEETDALEWFIGARLTEAGVWDHPRNSDGIVYQRTREREAHRLRLSGRIYTIDQKLHAFWLDLGIEGTELVWTLYFDVVATSRRARNAIDLHDDPKAIGWSVELEGRGALAALINC